MNELNKRYALRNIAGIYWLIDIEQEGQEYISPITFNECGAFIWERYSKGFAKDIIAEDMRLEYGIEIEQALHDINSFLEQLKSIDYLKV